MVDVILADDNYDVRQVLATLIKWNDLNANIVLIAENGAQVLDYLKNQRVDLIVSDILMPKLTGIER